jgi:hypothetical protein
MRFSVRPEVRGLLETTLVSRGLDAVARAGGGPVTVEHDGEHGEAVAALKAAGFRVQRDLVTMRRPVKPGDLSL